MGGREMLGCNGVVRRPGERRVIPHIVDIGVEEWSCGDQQRWVGSLTLYS